MCVYMQGSLYVLTYRDLYGTKPTHLLIGNLASPFDKNGKSLLKCLSMIRLITRFEHPAPLQTHHVGENGSPLKPL